MENTAVISCAPRSVNVTVRKPSSRPREYLTEREVEKLIDTASENFGKGKRVERNQQRAPQ